MPAWLSSSFSATGDSTDGAVLQASKLSASTALHAVLSFIRRRRRPLQRAQPALTPQEYSGDRQQRKAKRSRCERQEKIDCCAGRILGWRVGRVDGSFRCCFLAAG